ncbi:DUF2325 domain-containing protein [Siminovitchia terrae]|nr:DUF2325 domain-containing protein [Siminovitchia terrae]
MVERFNFIQQKSPTSVSGEINAYWYSIQWGFKLNKVKACGGCHRFSEEIYRAELVKIWAQIRQGVFDNNFSYGGGIMRSLLIVGADHLGIIPEKLSSLGFDEVLHINGRKAKMVKMSIPENTSYILVLTDYVNHNLSTMIKQRAKKQAIPIFYAKRSWCSIFKALKNIL